MPGGLHPWTRFDGSVGWVTVVLAPLDMNRVGGSRPVVHEALTGSGLVEVLDCTLRYDRDGSNEGSDGEEVSALVHRFLLCVWCLSPREARADQGIRSPGITLWSAVCSQIKSLDELELVLVTLLVGVDMPGEWHVVRVCWSLAVLKECSEHLHDICDCLAVESQLTLCDSDADVLVGVDNCVAEFITLGHKLFSLDVFSGEIHVS